MKISHQSFRRAIQLLSFMVTSFPLETLPPHLFRLITISLIFIDFRCLPLSLSFRLSSTLFFRLCPRVALNHQRLTFRQGFIFSGLLLLALSLLATFIIQPKVVKPIQLGQLHPTSIQNGLRKRNTEQIFQDPLQVVGFSNQDVDVFVYFQKDIVDALLLAHLHAGIRNMLPVHQLPYFQLERHVLIQRHNEKAPSFGSSRLVFVFSV